MSTPSQRPPAGPPAAPPRRPARGGQPGTRPDPEAAAAVSRATWSFLLFVVAALFALGLPLPWQLATLGFAAGAVVSGIRALLAARRTGRASAVGPLLLAGVALATMMSMSVVSAAVVYDLSVERQECLRRALTTSATQTCEKDFRDGVEARLQRLVERARAPRP